MRTVGVDDRVDHHDASDDEHSFEADEISKSATFHRTCRAALSVSYLIQVLFLCDDRRLSKHLPRYERQEACLLCT